MADPIRRKRSWRHGTQPAEDSSKNAPESSLRRQLRRHSVALISLALAATSLGYNTWRNETSEQHRNWRQASFQVLIETGELEQIVLYRRYFHQIDEDNPISNVQGGQDWVAGWGKVSMIRDLTSLMPTPLPDTGRAMHESWNMHAAQLDGISDRRDVEAARHVLNTLVSALEQNNVQAAKQAKNNLISGLKEYPAFAAVADQTSTVLDAAIQRNDIPAAEIAATSLLSTVREIDQTAARESEEAIKSSINQTREEILALIQALE